MNSPRGFGFGTNRSFCVLVRLTGASLLAAAVGAGCEEPRMLVIRTDVQSDTRRDATADDRAPPPDVASDSGVSMDTGTNDVTSDTGVDVPTDTRTDTGVDSGVDSGADASVEPRCTPTIDGTINAAEWAMGLRSTNTALPSAWGPNELRDLYLCYNATTLFVGVRGSVESAPSGGAGANAIVLYVDRDFRGGAGGTATGISLFSALNDRTGALDSALSADFRPTAAVDGFGVEAAFGIAGMRNLDTRTSDETQGWRLFWPAGGTPDRRSNFAYVLTGVDTRCVDNAGTDNDACESSISWASLFETATPPASTTVAVFARVVNAGGAMSPNQTLPQDDPSNPRNVGRVAVFSVR